MRVDEFGSAAIDELPGRSSVEARYSATLIRHERAADGDECVSAETDQDERRHIRCPGVDASEARNDVAERAQRRIIYTKSVGPWKRQVRGRVLVLVEPGPRGSPRHVGEVRVRFVEIRRTITKTSCAFLELVDEVRPLALAHVTARRSKRDPQFLLAARCCLELMNDATPMQIICGNLRLGRLAFEEPALAGGMPRQRVRQRCALREKLRDGLFKAGDVIGTRTVLGGRGGVRFACHMFLSHIRNGGAEANQSGQFRNDL